MRLKMKIQITLFVLSSLVVSIYGMIGNKCWSHTDCGPRQCCAGVSSKSPGACAYQPQRDQKCYPWIWPGSKVKCPCVLGTTCSDDHDDPNNTVRQYRCVKLVLEPDEENERYSI